MSISQSVTLEDVSYFEFGYRESEKAFLLTVIDFMTTDDYYWLLTDALFMEGRTENTQFI